MAVLCPLNRQRVTREGIAPCCMSAVVAAVAVVIVGKYSPQIDATIIVGGSLSHSHYSDCRAAA